MSLVDVHGALAARDAARVGTESAFVVQVPREVQNWMDRPLFHVGALGVGVGFGLQNIANNFISDLVLLVEQPIRVGQIVEMDGLLGPVVRIGARSTWVHTGTNAVIIVPNTEFVSTRVLVKVKMKIAVGYGSDPEKVPQLLLEVARTHPQALADPAPGVLFQEFGDSALNFAIFQTMRDNNVEIPFPQRDVHIRSEAAPALPQAG